MVPQVDGKADPNHHLQKTIDETAILNYFTDLETSFYLIARLQPLY